MAEKTINIIGRDVKLRYCAATETGFEKLTGKSINDISFTTQEDVLTLSIAAIVAAYARGQEEPPVKSDDVLYDATPKDIVDLIKAVIELRAEWYNLPGVVQKEIAKEAEDIDESEREKNA